MAHFLEHMVFKGGESYATYRDVNNTAERLGAQLNAYTSHDVVAFHVTCRAEAVMEAADLLTDFVGRLPPRRRRARARARRGDPGDRPLRRRAGERGLEAARPRGLRRPPARPRGPRTGRAPAELHPRGHGRLPRAPLGARRAAAPSSPAISPRSTPTRLGELFGRFPNGPIPPERRAGAGLRAPRGRRGARDQPVAPAPATGARRSIPATCASAPRSASTRPCSAARWARACSTRSASSAGSATRSAPPPRPTPTRRTWASPRASTPSKCVEAYRRIVEIVDELAADGPTEEEVERARAYAAGSTVLALEGTDAVARAAAARRSPSARSPRRRRPSPPSTPSPSTRCARSPAGSPARRRWPASGPHRRTTSRRAR